jgi:hypothetical protein
MELTARNVSLQEMADLLRTQDGAKADAVVHASKIVATDSGQIRIDGTKPLKVADEVLTEDGVTPAQYLDMNGLYDLTDVSIGHLADRLGIRVDYLRKLAANRPDILAANVNGWLHGNITPGDTDRQAADGDARSFTVRSFQTPDSNIFRGLLSDRFSIIDNLDVLDAVFKGIKAAGFGRDDLAIDGCDLTEHRMRVRVAVPAAQVAAPTLFAGYRSPFGDGPGSEVRVGGRGGWDANGWDIDSARAAAARENMGYAPGTEPILFAGFEFGNGELGGSATYVVPRAVARICRNGLTLPLDAARKTHVGAKLEDGVIDWSSTTRRKTLELITSKVADAVEKFASAEFWTEAVEAIEAKAGVQVVKAEDTIKAVSRALKFTEAQGSTILDHFIRGGQMTAGGIVNAITSAAQTVTDVEVSADMERRALRALDLVH